MVEKLLRRLQSRKGQAIIEFVVIFPLFIMLFAAIIDFGIALDRRIVLQHAVREGARYAAVHIVEDDIKQRTVAQAQDLIAVDDVCVEYEAGTSAGDPVRVRATFDYQLVFVGPILTGLFGVIGFDDTITMTPSGTARLELSASGASPCLF